MTRVSMIAESPGAAGPALKAVPALGEIFGTPASRDLSWQRFALCAQADPDSWYVEKGESNLPAKRICATCPVRQICLEHALETDEPWGVWGGLSVHERRKLKRQAAA